jgi:malonyl-CoA O-methyltransferase
VNHRAATKAAVAAAFSAAAETYDDGADVQRHVADTLARRIAALPLPPRPRILEIGCGTGFLSRALAALPHSDLLLTDISEAMIDRCRETLGSAGDARFLVMDGEAPSLAGGGFDLICASLVFQWFDDLPASLNRLAGLLASGGHLAFAILAAGSFKEWHDAHSDAGLTAAAQNYPSAAELAHMLPGAAVTDIRLVRHYHDGLEFLDHLKQIGAHRPADDRRPLSPGALRGVLRRFEAGISVTYTLAYASYLKP